MEKSEPLHGNTSVQNCPPPLPSYLSKPGFETPLVSTRGEQTPLSAWNSSLADTLAMLGSHQNATQQQETPGPSPGRCSGDSRRGGGVGPKGKPLWGPVEPFGTVIGNSSTPLVTPGLGYGRLRS